MKSIELGHLLEIVSQMAIVLFESGRLEPSDIHMHLGLVHHSHICGSLVHKARNFADKVLLCGRKLHHLVLRHVPVPGQISAEWLVFEGLERSVILGNGQ